MTLWSARASSYVYRSIYGHKKKVCLEQNISVGTIHASFHNFHNVSVYVKWPQKLVMERVINKQLRCLTMFYVFSCWTKNSICSWTRDASGHDGWFRSHSKRATGVVFVWNVFICKKKSSTLESEETSLTSLLYSSKTVRCKQFKNFRSATSLFVSASENIFSGFVYRTPPYYFFSMRGRLLSFVFMETEVNYVTIAIIDRKFSCPIIYMDSLRSIYNSHNTGWDTKAYSWFMIFRNDF